MRRVGQSTGSLAGATATLIFGPFFPGEVVEEIVMVFDLLDMITTTIGSLAMRPPSTLNISTGETFLFASLVTVPVARGVPVRLPVGFVAGFDGRWYLAVRLTGESATGGCVFVSVSRKEWFTPVPEPEEQVF